ncbi:MAG: VRR-NUC domain-containing protein [Gammaproteobacteria bacterium]|nr:MAG: VRR-NUC domain-containing protein [Gammaproteobacteria bacterium]
MKAKHSEKSIEAEICKYAESKGVLQYKFVSPGCRGVPDRMFICNGVTMFIEFKAACGPVSNLQRRRISAIRDAGAQVFIVDSLVEGHIVIDDFVNTQC